MSTVDLRSNHVVAALGLVVGLAACRQNDDPAGATDLLASVQSDDYQSWDRAPGYEERRPATSPHSDNVDIFVNDVVATALDGGGESEWPVGSIIAKDGYADDGTYVLTALMEKREDGWFWAEYEADGSPRYSGKPTICTDCHRSGSDFVQSFSLP